MDEEWDVVPVEFAAGVDEPLDEVDDGVVDAAPQPTRARAVVATPRPSRNRRSVRALAT
jgi:hypothetical protein